VQRTLALGPFRVDARNKLLFHGSKPLRLGQRSVALLLALVEKPGAVVSKNALIEAAWPNQAVEDNNLTVQIAALRRVLATIPGGNHWIETMPRRGYRFVGPLVTAAQKDILETPPQADAAPDLAAAQHNDAERRQITAMSCELVGNPGRADDIDLEDWREAVGAFRHCVSEGVRPHYGFIANHVGKNVLVVFGYPEAHEDDAERAVRAGLELCASVSALRPGDVTMRCRAGIATGVVIIHHATGAGEARDHEILGDTPEVAAQLRISAPPDTVTIGSVTRRLIGDLFHCRELGAIETAGAEPIRAWQVLGESIVASRFEALRGSVLSPLIGRDEEIELLLRRWKRASAGNGQVVLISGEPGIGKSRLTAELAERLGKKPLATNPLRFPGERGCQEIPWTNNSVAPAKAGAQSLPLARTGGRLTEIPGSPLTRERRGKRAGEPRSVLRYFCSPYHQDTAFHPFIAQLERAAGFAHDDTPTQRLDKLTNLIAPGGSDRDEVTLITDLLSLPSGAAELGLTPQRKREKLLAALLHQLDASTRRQPVLMVVEDLHWSDPSSRELIDLIIERAANLPLLLILTFRPEFQAPWNGLPQVTALILRRLDPHSSAAMVDGIAGNDKLPDGPAAEIVEHADGVPLFVEELTRAAIEAGPGGTALADTAPLSPSGVPPALRAPLVARLDRLGPAPREIAQIGAVLGREFSYDLIARVAQPQRAEADLQAALGALTGAGLLFCRGVAPRSSYLFKHALIQDAAYEGLLRARRQELHRAAAQTIAAEFAALAEAQPELIARHWSEAGDAGRAFAAWRKAGDVARARNAFPEARAAYRHALDRLALTPPSPERDASELELLLATNQMIAATRGSTSLDRVEITARAADLAARTGNLGRLAEQLYSSWRAAGVAGDHPSAMIWADRLLDVARRDGGAFTRGLATYAQLWTRFYIGDLPGAEDHFVSGRAFLSDPDLRRYFVATWTLSTAGFNAWIMGRADEARARMRSTLATIEDDAFARIIVEWSSSFLHVMLREPEQAALLAAQAIATAAEHGFRQFGLGPRMSHGWVQAQLGHADQGAVLIREALTAYRANGSLVSVPTRLTWLAEAQALGGAVADALRTIEEALTVNPAERYWLPETLRVRGDIRRRQGEAELAEADFRDAIALARELSAKAWELRAATSLARLWCEQGRRAEARELLAPIYGWFTEGFDTQDLKEARALLEELA
jgi:DNA-binding winged helix-turn-helix (wHTH) protein/tetratricopeptide (TPR) repeat protein